MGHAELEGLDALLLRESLGLAVELDLRSRLRGDDLDVDESRAGALRGDAHGLECRFLRAEPRGERRARVGGVAAVVDFGGREVPRDEVLVVDWDSRDEFHIRTDTVNAGGSGGNQLARCEEKSASSSREVRVLPLTDSSIVTLGPGDLEDLGETEGSLLVGDGASHGVEEDVLLEIGSVGSVLLDGDHVALGEELRSTKVSAQPSLNSSAEELTSLNLT